MILKNRAQCGRSMIEMLGVLAIVGILSAGGIAGYSMAMQNHKTNAFIEKVQLIAQRMREIYDGDYPTSTSGNLTKLGLIGNANTPFGGGISVGKSNKFPGAFYVAALDDIPDDVCVKVMTTYWGDKGVFEGIYTDVNGNKAYTYTNGKYPMSAAAAISACKSRGTRKSVSFWFY